MSAVVHSQRPRCGNNVTNSRSLRREESSRSLFGLQAGKGRSVIPGPHPGSMGKSKRRSSPRVRRGQQGRQHQALTEPTSPAQRVIRLSTAQLLERIERARLTRDEAEAELAVLIDSAVGLGVGWPEIAARLGVTRPSTKTLV